MNRPMAFLTMLLLPLLTLMVGGCGSDNTTTPPAAFSVKGTVTTASGVDLSGVTLTAQMGTATPITGTTTAAGEFTLVGLAAGNHTVRPSKDGYMFTPTERTITVTNADVVDVTFQMTQIVEIPMVAVEPDRFTMGGIYEYLGGNTAGPQHQVTLTRAMWVGTYEVTQAEYQAVMGANPSTFKNPMHPVTDIDSYQMMEFCNRLSEMNGYDKVYVIHYGDNETRSVEWNWDASGYRLPVDAEWEYFARAGTTENVYFGHIEQANENVLDAYAWWRTYAPEQGGSSTTRPVGLKPANPWGLQDILGNVEEVCFDSKRPYDEQAVTDPIGLPLGRDCIARGGSYLAASDFVNCVARRDVPYLAVDRSRGFRVVRTKH